MKWHVISPDMWGHVPSDCCQSYGCNCVADDGTHDDETCGCHEFENDRHTVGSLDLSEDAPDADFIRALVIEGFLTDAALTEATINDIGDGFELDIHDKEGRKVLVIQQAE